MHKKHFLFLLTLVLAGCADKYDRMTSRMIMDSYSAKGQMPLNTVAAPAVELYYINRYGANALQKKTAEETAQRYLMNQRHASATHDPGSSRGVVNGRTSTPRYVAIDVPRIAASRGATSVMIFDTQSRKIIGNSVYDLDISPKIQQPIKFDTCSAQYIGNGSIAE